MPALVEPVAARKGGRWGDLRLRVLSAAVLAPAAVLCIWFGGAAWAALMAVAAVGLGVEWAALCGFSARRWPGVCLPAAVLIAGATASLGHVAAALLWVAVSAAALLPTGRWMAAGVLYVGVPVVALAWLRGRGDVGGADVLFLMLVVWASDIGAYIAGRIGGGPRLAPSISPGKTWSGAVGGLVVAMAVGVGVAHVLAPGGLGRAAAIAGVLGVASQAGDLLESWFKRRFGVKDSGRLIPGHGGLLDRLDGLLAAAPAAALVAMAVGRGGVLWK